jgi:hypothetical protein
MILEYHTYSKCWRIYPDSCARRISCGESQSSKLIVAEECGEEDVVSVDEEAEIDYETYLPNVVIVQEVDQEGGKSWVRGLLIGEDENNLYVVTTGGRF